MWMSGDRTRELDGNVCRGRKELVDPTDMDLAITAQ